MVERKRLAAVAAIILSAVLVGGACGGGDVAGAGVGQKDVDALPKDLVPAEMLGLTVTQEDAKDNLAGRDRTYIEAIGLYSLRAEELVQATLQVSKFGDDAEYRSPQFRAAIVGQVGTTKPRATRLGDDTVYLTTGTKQRISVWFKDRFLFILAVRDDFDRPRTLLREALEITP